MTNFTASIVVAAAGLAMSSLHALSAAAQTTARKVGETVMTSNTAKQERNKEMVQERFAAWANGTGNSRGWLPSAGATIGRHDGPPGLSTL